jgi:hypothetical protein
MEEVPAMTRRPTLAILSATLATLALAGPGVAQSEAELYTGCLDTSGVLTNVALGDEPLGPCDRSQQLAQWNIEGPMGEEGAKGDPGDQGEQGEKGEQGDPGSSNTYRTSKEITGEILLNGVVKCDEGDLITGGGYRLLSGPSSTVTESYPSGSRAWTVTIITNDGSLDQIGAELFAVCSDLEPTR